MTRHHGVVIVDRGAAIVSLERSDDGALLVTGIERLAFDLSVVTERVRALTVPDDRYVVDGDGLGGALWTILGHDRDRQWTLYTARGQERQALVDHLLVAMQEDRFRFAAGLAEQDAMSKALLGYRRTVRDDGVIGSELVVALLLALIPPPRHPVAGFLPADPSAWGMEDESAEDYLFTLTTREH